MNSEQLMDAIKAKKEEMEAIEESIAKLKDKKKEIKKEIKNMWKEFI